MIEPTFTGVYGMATGAYGGAAAHCATGRKYGMGRNALLLGLLTASFDIFLVMVIGGFTLRVHQPLVLAAIVSALALTYRAEKIKAPLGWQWLILWTLFMVAFVPNTMYVTRSLGYAIWLMLDVLIVFVTVQLFGSPRWIETLLRRYLLIFAAISGFGLLQLLLGLAHLPAPFVQQWAIYGVWPRINGFSYEPSYFCTYILMGWVFSAWLVEKNVYVLGRALTRTTFAVTTAGMVLSTSRMGAAMMLVWGMGYAWRSLSFNRAPRFSAVFLSGCLCGCMAVTLWAVKSQGKIEKDLALLASGTGLFGTAAHSVNDREKSLSNTFTVFEKSPLVGYSLGGVATAIAVDHGTLVAGNSDAKHNEGGSVIVEVLAASGIIGVIPFLLYFGILIGKSLIVSRRVGTQAGAVLAALTWAFLMELVILQFNQNILRAYLWFHVGVLSAAYTAVLAGAWRVPGIAAESSAPTQPPRVPVTGLLQ